MQPANRRYAECQIQIHLGPSTSAMPTQTKSIHSIKCTYVFIFLLHVLLWLLLLLIECHHLRFLFFYTLNSSGPMSKVQKIKMYAKKTLFFTVIVADACHSFLISTRLCSSSDLRKENKNSHMGFHISAIKIVMLKCLNSSHIAF